MSLKGKYQENEMELPVLHRSPANKLLLIAIGIINIHRSTRQDRVLTISRLVACRHQCRVLSLERLLGQFQRHMVKLVAGRLSLDHLRLGHKHNHLWDASIALANPEKYIGQRRR